jgi:hypothetical protein
MNFQKYYFKEDEQINEFAVGKDSYFTNVLRKAVGSARRRINPKALETTELTPAGYTELFNRLTNQYGSNKNTKYKIKDLFQGVFNPKDAQGVFGDIDINDKKQIEVVSYFKINNNGAIALYNLKDQNDEDHYFIGIDGKGQKFFSARPKDGGMGMIFKGWLSLQRANKMGILKGYGLTPEKVKKKNPFPYKYEIDKDVYDKMTPEMNANFKESNNAFSLFNLFNEEVIAEKIKYIFKKDGKWISTSSSKGSPFEYSKLDPDDTYVAVKTSEPVGSVKKAEQLEKDEELQKEIDNQKKNIETSNKEKPEDKNKKDFDKYDVKEFGELYVDIHEELKENPINVKSTDKIQYGWKYIFKNNGRIFIYQTKDNKYKIAFDVKGKEMADKFNLISKFNLEQDNPKDYPEED